MYDVSALLVYVDASDVLSFCQTMTTRGASSPSVVPHGVAYVGEKVYLCGRYEQFLFGDIVEHRPRAHRGEARGVYHIGRELLDDSADG